MRRVMIIGQPGSGKSTLARQIGERTGLLVFHIDHIHWKPGWVERPRAEKTVMCSEVHALDRWVFEGGHSVTWPERLQRCDTIIWLDFSVNVRIRRVLLRSLRHWRRTRLDLPDGCKEQFDWEFFRWIWDTRQSGRTRIERLVGAAPPEKDIFVFQSVKEIREFLRCLGRQA